MEKITLVVLGDPTVPTLKKLESLGPDVRLKTGKTAESLQPELAEANVLFNWQSGKDEIRKVMEGAPHLQWIHARFAGLDHILFPELIESPIPLTNGSGVFSQSLGEFAILGALYFAKYVPRLNKSKSARAWEVFTVEYAARQTIGIVGHGDIGRAVAWRAKALGMRVLALRRDTSRRAGDEHVERVYPTAELHAMLAECDYVVVTAPLTPETRHMMGKKEFEAMKPTAIIMNIGRGPVIDESAMIAALQTGRIQGAALDVFEVEPLPQDSPLWSMDNVLISPHSADHTTTWLEDSMDFFLDQFARFRSGGPLLNVVNKRAGY